MEELLVSDGTDHATLIKKEVGQNKKQIDTWILNIDIREVSKERSQRMLEAAAQTVSIAGVEDARHQILMPDIFANTNDGKIESGNLSGHAAARGASTGTAAASDFSTVGIKYFKTSTKSSKTFNCDSEFLAANISFL